MVICVGCRCHWVEPRTRQHLIWDLLYNALGLVCDITIPLCRDRKLGREVLSRICARHDGRCCDDALSRDRFGEISVFRALELSRGAGFGRTPEWEVLVRDEANCLDMEFLSVGVEAEVCGRGVFFVL